MGKAPRRNRVKMGQRVKTPIPRSGMRKGSLGTVKKVEKAEGQGAIEIVWDKVPGTIWYSKEAYETTHKEMSNG
jgi:hypothetical protein